MTDTTIAIEGMSCQHCVARVKKAIDGLPGVSTSDVAIGSAVVTFDQDRLGVEDLMVAIEKAGYKVKR